MHQLVAEAFLGPRPFPGAVVLHWDDDGFNNHLGNLRWGSETENRADARRNRAKRARHLSVFYRYLDATGKSIEDIEREIA